MADSKQIETDDDGVRLDSWFRRHYPGLPHGRLEKLLRTGQVRLDGKRAKAGDRVAAGQMVRLPPQLASVTFPERRADAPSGGESLRDLVLHMDPSVIVLNKPP